jgi:transcriptional regulator with XRE-family HTH domain
MDAATTLQRARTSSGLSQRELAERAGTSQATVSAYESGRKHPSVATFSRLLSAAGWRLRTEPTARPVREPTLAELRRVERGLADVLALAAMLPTRHRPNISAPPIRTMIERRT